MNHKNDYLGNNILSRSLCVSLMAPEMPDLGVILQPALSLASSIDSISIVLITRLQKSLKHKKEGFEK